MRREIIVIDEQKCDGCGLCVPACQEGALGLVGGKIRLVAENLCDGLGACLGECPKGALRVEAREVDRFDQEAVAERLPGLQSQSRSQSQQSLPSAGPATCPSSQFVQIAHPRTVRPNAPDEPPSELTHWPVQLALLSPTAPVLQGASLLLAADCVPVAYPAFHQKLLRGRSVAVACPKLDTPEAHLAKLTEILLRNELRDITVAHMQVPCCSGLTMLAIEARRRTGKAVPLVELVVGTGGDILARRQVA